MQLPPCQGQGPARLLTISFASAGPEAGTTPFRVRVRIGVRDNLLTISNDCFPCFGFTQCGTGIHHGTSKLFFFTLDTELQTYVYFFAKSYKYFYDILHSTT
jgi:hypothetical protein